MLTPPGVHAEPDRRDLKLHGAIQNGRLQLRLTAATPWHGALHFDYPRGMLYLGRRLPRSSNAKSPRWYAIRPTRIYEVKVNGKTLEPMLGDDLLLGLPLKVEKGTATVVVEPIPGPPYGGRALHVEAPPVVGGDGPVRIPVTIRNGTGQPQTVRLATTFGTIAPGELKLAPDAAAKAIVSGKLVEDTQATITAAAPGTLPSARTVRLVHDKNLVGLVGFDDQRYKGTPYLWCGKEPFEFTLPARKGKPHTLHLLWGSKGDDRKAKVTLNGKAREVSQGGYDGFKWLALPIEPELVKGDALKVRIERLGEVGAAFISQAKLTAP